MQNINELINKNNISFEFLAQSVGVNESYLKNNASKPLAELSRALQKKLEIFLSNFQNADTNVTDIMTKIKKRLETSDYSTITAEEFFFLAGLVSRAIFSRNEELQLDAVLVNQRPQNIKKQIRKQYQACVVLGTVALENTKLNNALALILAYEENEPLKDYKTYSLMGVIQSPIIFADIKSKKG